MLNKRPYLLFFIFALLLYACSFITANERALDINIADTYYITREKELLLFFSLFLLFLGALYLLMDLFRFPMVLLLSKIHVYGTLLFSLVFAFYYWKVQIPDLPERYYTITSFPEDGNFKVLTTLLLIIFIQILFIINIFVSITKRIKAQAT